MIINMNRTKRVVDIFMDSLTIKLVTIVLFFFLIFPTLKPVMYGLVKIVLFWGGAKLFYDLFTKRTFLRAQNIGWLILFLAAESISVVLNHSVGLKDNASLMCYTAVAMLVLYPNDEEKEPVKLMRELRLLGFVYIVLCAAASVVSLIIFARGINNELTYLNFVYYTGMFEGRLWGIFSNPNFPAAILAAAVSLLLFPVCRAVTKNKKTLPLQYTVLILCLLADFWYTVLAQSRGSIISFLLFLFVYLFFLFRKKIYYKLKYLSLSVLFSVLSSVCVVCIVNFSIPLILSGSAALPAAFAKAGTGEASLDENTASGMTTEFDDVDADGETSELGRNQVQEQTNMLTGRSVIWRQGLEKFTQKPLFGFGNIGCTDGVTLHGIPGEEPVKHLHNVVVQSLAANGLAGTVPLLIFAVCALAAIARSIYHHRRDSWEHSGILCGCFAFVAFYIANNMIEVFLVYSVSIPNFLFWIVFGYMMSLSSPEQPVSKFDRFLRKFSRPAKAETGRKAV